MESRNVRSSRDPRYALAIQARNAEIEDDASSGAELAEPAPEGERRVDANWNGNARALRHAPAGLELDAMLSQGQ